MFGQERCRKQYGTIMKKRVGQEQEPLAFLGGQFNSMPKNRKTLEMALYTIMKGLRK